jgi:RNA polymerase sigma-70 factor, ECF subfamily
VNDQFVREADPYRRELLAYCYRMLGSAHDAEDLVQETYLRAWQAYDDFEGRASMRTWLYRIATNACLRALENRERRPLPSGLGAPATDPHLRMTRSPEVPWLEPLPDAMYVAQPVDPAAAAVSHEGMRLAFVAALQHLPARQRAVLILCEVLQWPAAEAAGLLDLSPAAVSSALQRARARLAALDLSLDSMAEPPESERRLILDRYVRAFQDGDLELLISILAEDVVIEMPPNREYFEGIASCRTFLATRILRPDRFRLFPVGANGQPAFVLYADDGLGSYVGHSVNVLTLSPKGITRLVAFFGSESLRLFNVPERLGDGGEVR